MGLPIGMGTRWRITSLSLTPLLHVTLNERVFFRKMTLRDNNNPRFVRLHPRPEWNWPTSCLNVSETQEVEIQTNFPGRHAPRPFWGSFRKSACLYPIDLRLKGIVSPVAYLNFPPLTCLFSVFFSFLFYISFSEHCRLRGQCLRNRHFSASLAR